METIMGETLLSNSVHALLEKLTSTDFIDKFRRTKVDVSLLKKLKNTLVKILILLNDDADFKEWLDMVRYAVFEVYNLFDQINTEALRCKVEALTPTTTKVRNFFSVRFKQFHEVIDSEMLKLIERLECLILRREQRASGFSNYSYACPGTSTSSILYEGLGVSNSIDDSVLVHESSIYGRDSDIKKLRNLLLSEDVSDGDCKLRIISIVGMGGIGKTILAKLLYDDPQVKDKFGVRGWAHVSKDFAFFKVLETILESITPKAKSNFNLNSLPLDFVNTRTNDRNTSYPDLLLATLQQILSTSLFLLVLDDVWDAKSVNWIYLMDIFNVGEMGSRIIITTRDERVALSMQTFLSVHHLRPLESKDCWSLVARYAFGAWNNQQQQSDLEEVGREIARKCGGLPLVAIALGKFLRIKLSPYYWNNVPECDIWKLVNHDVQHSLQLSYHYLPAPLKRCFAYCSIFPKMSILEKSVVVQLWIAEGLVESSTDQEKVGEEYFDVLVSRSLIHRQSISDEEENFEMHCFIHDLATLVSSSYCIRLDEHNLHERIHNLSYNRRQYDSFNKFDKLYRVKDLRTFLALPLQKQVPFCLLSNKIVDDLLPTMKQLRVLSLSNYKNITRVPNTIGNLLYLRYLNLSHTNIERLPSETCKLYNLQFLLLSGCKRLTELPGDMGKLINLRHLDVSDTALREMPIQIAKLENLHTLSDFVVSKPNGGLKVAELGKFPHLHGKLSISQLQNVNDPSEAFQANMKMKESIHTLSLEWDSGSTFSNSQVQSAVLEYLRPSSNLKSLTIQGYGGINFPNWLGDFLFGNMVYLRISNCDNCIWLPPLGQLANLKELIINSMISLKSVGTEFYGSDNSYPSFQPFRSLETLHFEDMPEWEEWDMIACTATKFPSLKSLLLGKCPKLGGNIAEKLPSLTELELRECPLLVASRHSVDNRSFIITIPSLDVFSQLMLPLNSLRRLTIDGLQSLTSFPTNGLPKTLKFLIISNCENLEFLPRESLHNYTSLEELKISYSCNSMMSFTLDDLPVLKSLFIEGCKNLKSISVTEDAPQKSLSFLRSIRIWDCNELESFPPGGLVTPNLVYFAVWKCEKLPSLPKALNTLSDLQEMAIDNLPNLQSYFIDDLPINLQELTVGSVGGIMWNTEPTWEHLTCLSVLRISSDDTVNKLTVPLLPASLVTLCISGFNDTGIDGKWFQHLTSLRNIEIVNALKLKSLPKEGFPSSLSVLSITCCPLLVARLRRKRGKEWRKIARIPSIIIDDELIT
ncbi:hypothetical protein RYX36_016871 [Vicia faba]